MRMIFFLLMALVGTACFGADSLETGIGFSVVPFVSFSPETKIQAGVAGFVRYRHSTDSLLRVSSVGVGVQYTQLNQIGLGLYPEIYLNNNGIRIEGAVEYYVFPYNFYGIGNNNPVENLELYTPQGIKAYTTVLFAVQGNRVQQGLSVGMRAELRYDTIRSIQPRSDGTTGPLGTGLVAGSTGGWYNGIGPVVSYDTRNNNFSADSGMFIEAYAINYASWLGSSFTALASQIDSRLYTTVYPQWVLANHTIIRNVAGTPTFQQWPSIGGGNNLRGIYDAQQRSRMAVSTQTEVRFPLIGRFRGVAFVDAGQVAEQLSQFRLNQTYVGIGGGLRFLLVPEEKIAIRFDVGLVRGVVQYYLNFNEAF
jgi:hypothetical protein